MTIDSKILGIVTLLYLSVFLIHVLFFAARRNEKILRAMWLVLYGTFALHTVGLVVRWVESYRLGLGHAPLANFYESLIFFSWCVAFILVLMKRRLNFPVITALASLVALFFIGYASLSPSVDKSIQPLIPALQSNWLHVHVFTCFIAYAAFAISFLSGLFFFFPWKGVVPPKDKLEELNYRSVMVGFPMLTAGILTGAVWAHYAWGSYWSWDPKETWSLITWIVYALFLHARVSRGWKGNKIAALTIIGFGSVIFTYIGVNFLLAGLHSYGAS
jgi:ABC-type transport system involved in cytochrome c biogenesis permease subunit